MIPVVKYFVILLILMPTVISSVSVPRLSSKQLSINQPTKQPTKNPSYLPTSQPSSEPSHFPTLNPSSQPSVLPSSEPSYLPTLNPSLQPSSKPSQLPIINPSSQPSVEPTSEPSQLPTLNPSQQIIISPSSYPTSQPSLHPNSSPSSKPSILYPTPKPSRSPTTWKPTRSPTRSPSHIAVPTIKLTKSPSNVPTRYPISKPTNSPLKEIEKPTTKPSQPPVLISDSSSPTRRPSANPFIKPSQLPSQLIPDSNSPIRRPSAIPFRYPSKNPTPNSMRTTPPTDSPTIKTIKTQSPSMRGSRPHHVVTSKTTSIDISLEIQNVTTIDFLRSDPYQQSFQLALEHAIGNSLVDVDLLPLTTTTTSHSTSVFQPVHIYVDLERNQSQSEMVRNLTNRIYSSVRSGQFAYDVMTNLKYFGVVSTDAVVVVVPKYFDTVTTSPSASPSPTVVVEAASEHIKWMDSVIGLTLTSIASFMFVVSIVLVCYCSFFRAKGEVKMGAKVDQFYTIKFPHKRRGSIWLSRSSPVADYDCENKGDDSNNNNNNNNSSVGDDVINGCRDDEHVEVLSEEECEWIRKVKFISEQESHCAVKRIERFLKDQDNYTNDSGDGNVLYMKYLNNSVKSDSVSDQISVTISLPVDY